MMGTATCADMNAARWSLRIPSLGSLAQRRRGRLRAALRAAREGDLQLLLSADRRLGRGEDLLSIVFLEAWRRRRKQLPPDKVLPWLYGIATNVVRNRRRAERRYRAALARVPAPGFDPDFGDEIDARLDDERLIGRALELLAELPAGQQDALVLCDWSGRATTMRRWRAVCRSARPLAPLACRSALRELELASGHAPVEKAYE